MSDLKNIPEGWEETMLGEVVKRVTKGTTPKTFSRKENDVNYIKSDALNYEGTLDDSKFVKISHEINETLKRSQLKLNDLVLSMAGAYLGKTGLIKQEHLPANTNQAVAIITVDQNIVHHLFLWYKLRETRTVKYFNSIPSQSAQPNINFQEIKSLNIFLPPLPEQKSIAAILTSFDKKIELLQSQNKTLETLAQTIFKEWFGKYQVGDELPEGWRFGTLGDVAFNHSKTFKFSDEKVVFINTGDVLEGQFLHSNEIPPINLPGQAKKAIELYDILYSEIRPKNKRFAFVDFETPNYVVSTKFMVIRPKGDFSPFILYLILKNQNTINEFNIVAESRSGTFPQITFDAVKDFPILIPTKEKQNEFENLLLPIMEKKRVNHFQLKTLTKTRDTLLPKLMSGAIRVKDV